MQLRLRATLLSLGHRQLTALFSCESTAKPRDLFPYEKCEEMKSLGGGGGPTLWLVVVPRGLCRR